jgi:hypothetical protein
MNKRFLRLRAVEFAALGAAAPTTQMFALLYIVALASVGLCFWHMHIPMLGACLVQFWGQLIVW